MTKTYEARIYDDNNNTLCKMQTQATDVDNAFDIIAEKLIAAGDFIGANMVTYEVQ